MKKQKILTIPLTLALVLSTMYGGNTKATAQSDDAPSDLHTFTRIQTGQNGSLARYKVIDENGNEVIPENSTDTISKRKAASLPTSYDSRIEKDSITSIKNQGHTGACWTFSSMKAMESSSIIKGLTQKDSTDFSENHLAWYTYTPLTDITNPLYGDGMYYSNINNEDKYNLGGNPYFASFMFANWWGPAEESVAPFNADTEADLTNMANTMNNADTSLRFQSSVHLKESICYDDSTRDEIKQAVMEHGALSVSMYMPSEGTSEYDEIVYENEEITSIYSDLTDEYGEDEDYANHCVTIVGWDDDFNTFASSPERSGAWLIANSYGSDYGMNGYFWLSYYDTSLVEFFSFEAESADTYDTNFQYDGLGWLSGFTDTDDITLQNIFTNKETTPQSISAVGFYTFAENQAYRIEVYRKSTEGYPTSGTLISSCTTNGTIAKSGYHTVPLNEAVTVGTGETFSIRVTFLANGGTSYALIEGTDNDGFSSKNGQSYAYFSSENRWYDTSTQSTGRGNTYNNVCIKAFANIDTEDNFAKQEAENPIPDSNIGNGGTNDTTTGDDSSTNNQGSQNIGNTNINNNANNSITKIVSSKKKLTIGKGEKVTLSIKTTPASAKSSLSYHSSNKKVATVSQKGKITGKKVGSATITIKASSGTKITIKVKVKKAPSSIKAKLKKKTLKKGKTTKIFTTLSKKSASYKLTFKSLNKKVATVTSSGKVKAKKKGTARIRVTTYNKKKAYVTVKVK